MKKQFQQITEQANAARERLKQIIRDLPDSADGVRMLGSRCGVVPFSLVAKHGFNLSAGYWLAHETKEMLLKIIDSNQTLETTVKAIEGILTTGKVTYRKHTEQIAPNVLQALKKAWEGK